MTENSENEERVGKKRFREMIKQEMKRRSSLELRLQQQERGHAAAWQRCKSDFLTWAQNYLVAYDPEHPQKFSLPPTIPFTPVGKQVDLCKWFQQHWEEADNGWISKSRKLGASYLGVGFAVWGWVFHEGFKGELTSYKEKYVDDRDNPDSLLEKARTIIRELPDWQIDSSVWEPRGKYDNYKKIINPEQNSKITGSVGTNASRSGRSSYIFADEAAFSDSLAEKRRAMRENASTVIECSTFNGQGEPFHQSVKKEDDEHVFILEWDDVPYHDKEWLEKKRDQYSEDPAGFAQEILRDVSQSREGGVVNETWVEGAVAFEEPESLRTAPIVLSVDVAGKGSNDTIACIRRRHKICDFQRYRGDDQSEIAGWIARIARDIRADAIVYDQTGVGASVGDDIRALPQKLKPEDCRIVPYVASQTPTDTTWPDGQKSTERFRMLRDELWWRIRERLRSTWAVMTGNGKSEIDIVDLISIPDHDKLYEELQYPEYDIQGKLNKIKIESKSDMSDRGLDSPDYADSVVQSELAFISDQADPSPYHSYYT